MHQGLLLGLACLAIATMAAVEPQAKAEPEADAATRAIIRALTAGAKAPARCAYDTAWGQYAVPAPLAKRSLGSTLDADVSASEEPLRIEDVIDPARSIKDAFCSQQEYRSYLAQRAAGSGDDPVSRTQYTYPVFDKRRRTAIVVVIAKEEGGFWARPNGERRMRPSELAITASVLKLEHGGWRIVSRETLAQT